MSSSKIFFVLPFPVVHSFCYPSPLPACIRSQSHYAAAARQRIYVRRCWSMQSEVDQKTTDSDGTSSFSTTMKSEERLERERRRGNVVDSKDLIEGELHGSPTDTYDGPPPGKIFLDEIQLAKQRKDLVEFAKALREMRLKDEREESRIFGFVPAAELLNGRLAMFFFAVGFLTEYWTGYTLPEQVEILFRTLGIIN